MTFYDINYLMEFVGLHQFKYVYIIMKLAFFNYPLQLDEKKIPYFQTSHKNINT